MEYNSTPHYKNIYSSASGRNMVSLNPANNMADDAKKWRKKTKACHADEDYPKKKLSSDTSINSSSSVTVKSDGFSVRGSKRKANLAEERPKKKIRASKDISDPSNIVTYSCCERVREMNVGSGLSSCSHNKEMYDISLPLKTSQAEFKANYAEIFQIGKGTFGSVYAGYRKADAMPVAIKHIQKEHVIYIQVFHNGMMDAVIEEVAVMVKAAGGAESPGRSAVIALLDIFDLEDELILILERPVPCVDLLTYCRAKGGYLEEDDTKIILRQIVDAAIEMHSNGVFHRDIKAENILIETGSDVLRVRVIDFGCGCLVSEEPYHRFSGTPLYAPPEFFLKGRYCAVPTTVWQLGALLYNLLDHRMPFSTPTYYQGWNEINYSLSMDCMDFLRLCLDVDPEKRATLERLQLHPWLRSTPD